MDVGAHVGSERSRAAAQELAVVQQFFDAHSAPPAPGACDFTFGNPHDMPLQGLLDALARAAQPLSHDWFAYKANEAEPRRVLASALARELGLPFAPADIALTAGATGAIALAFQMLANPGDEVVIPVPGWFLYAPMLRQAGLTPAKAALDPDTHDLDLEAIEAAITPRTRVVVINTPHNPTGRIYSSEALRGLAALLEVASDRINSRIFILSDEPYRRIRFDGLAFTSPANHYPWTVIDYSYGKVLLAPGQRLGYLALSPLLPTRERTRLRELLFPTQTAMGWNFPEAVMQHALPDLESVSLDLAELQRKRDRMLATLTESGYRMTRPEGTFYLWGQAPGGDALRFTQWLSERSVHVMPGTLFERPAEFRVCLTATAEMVERSLPSFAEAAVSLGAF